MTRLAIIHRITGLSSGTDISIITGSIVGGIYTGIQPSVTNIISTGYPVITGRWCAGLAIAGSGITRAFSAANPLTDWCEAGAMR